MKHNTNVMSRWMRLFGAMVILALMVPGVVFSQTAPVLNTADSFGILAAGAISGNSTVSGNVGTSTADVIPGTILAGAGWQVFTAGIPSVVTAHNDFGNAYTNALAANPGGTVLAATFPVVNVGNDLAHALTPGIYDITAPASMTANLFLNGAGIYIFKTSSTFNTTAGVVVNLSGGAVWSNIYWLVGGAVTLGAGSSVLEGSILCNVGAVTMTGPNSVDGRVLGNGAVSVGTATIGNAGIPLPVEMASFTATANRLSANLHWSTATETNNYGFEIERRQTGNWEKIGFVAGAGASSSPRSYSYTDKNLSEGSYAYRIKQVNKDGSFSYHGSAQVEIGSVAKKFELASNFPNPFNPSTTVQFTLENDGVATLTVYNVLGQEVMTLFNDNAQAGKLYQVKFDASKLPTGLYFAKLQSGNQRMMQKMALVK